jgi:nucleotide-binding universal stress UspA family protein
MNMTEHTNTKRIVVGVDGSASSKIALRWALRQAELTGSVVDAIHASQIPAGFDLPPLARPHDLEKSAEDILAKAVADVGGAHADGVLRTRVVQGPPIVVLMREARSADLLVVGSRGHGAFVGALLGSVSQHCVQHAACPVVVVRADRSRSDPAEHARD